jgi:hypothetical protein
MSGRLERLEEIDYGGDVRVEAKRSAELVNYQSGVTVWTGDDVQSLRVETRDVNSVVTEMSQAVQQSIDRLVSSLNQKLLPNQEVSGWSFQPKPRQLPLQ